MYDEAEKGDKHSAKRLTSKEEAFGKDDMAKAVARMQELNGIEATDKGVEEDKAKNEEETQSSEKSEGGESGAMEEQATTMDNKVRLPHEDESEEEY